MVKIELKHFTHILVGVDESEDAQLAFRHAINQAKQYDAELTITSILESEEMNVYQALNKDFINDRRDNLEKHILEYRKLAEQFGITKVNTIIGEGDPGETIIKKIIPVVSPDLLVVGSLSKTGIRNHFGSHADYMAKHAPISVLVVR